MPAGNRTVGVNYVEIINPPSAPSNLQQAGATQNSLTISWQDNSNNETGFKIYYWDGWNPVYLVSVGANVTSFTESSLSCGTTRGYQVTAYNGSGESAPTAWVDASTSACAPVADFDAWPQSGNAPLTVSMHNISSGNYSSCFWEYGDGATGASCDGYHDHTYSAADTYTVRLTVTGPGGSNIRTRAGYINVTSPCYILTRTHSGSGSDPVASPLNSTGCSTDQYVVGASISLTASPASGWRVSSWNGTNNDANTSTSNSVTMPAGNRIVNVTYEAIPPTCYTLSRTHSGSGSDPVASPLNSTGCSTGQYVSGASISLTASPASGWHVGSWSGTNNDANSSTNNSLTMPANSRTVSVNYEAIPPTCYTLSRTHSGSGSDPGASPSNSAGCSAGQYMAGASISLTANPASGWRVASWSGTNNDASTSTSNNLTMPASNRTVGVNYVEIINPPAAPSLLFPENGATVPSNNDMTFFWNSATGATEYLIEWWGGSYSTIQPCGWSSATSCYVGHMAESSTYSWHVKARNSAGESAWSGTWTFTVPSLVPTNTPTMTPTHTPTVTRTPTATSTATSTASRTPPPGHPMEFHRSFTGLRQLVMSRRTPFLAE